MLHNITRVNTTNHTLDWGYFDQFFIQKRNATREDDSNELERFFLINGGCVFIIMLSMSFCYMSHVFYNKWLKPLIGSRRRINSTHSGHEKIKEAKEEKKRLSMKNSYKKNGNLKVTVENEQEAGNFI